MGTQTRDSKYGGIMIILDSFVTGHRRFAAKSLRWVLLFSLLAACSAVEPAAPSMPFAQSAPVPEQPVNAGDAKLAATAVLVTSGLPRRKGGLQ